MSQQPAEFRLPSLKILTPNKIFYKNDESLSRLFSGCLVLEKLGASRDCKDGMIDLKISVPTLKHLDLDFNSYEPSSANRELTTLISLLFLFIHGFLTTSLQVHVTTFS